MAKPLGIVFWLLSLSCLALGFGNYIKTVNKYSRRAAIVQTGWKTQSVGWRISFLFGCRGGCSVKTEKETHKDTHGGRELEHIKQNVVGVVMWCIV